MKVSAVIVAKRTSERLKNKNMLPFGGSTILGHKINQLKECKRINEIVVGSDCDDILSFSEKLGAKPVKRKEKYCNESICPANKMIENMCSLINTDVVVWAHCTNPLIQSSTYDKAVDLFFLEKEEEDDRGVGEKFDSLISVDLVQEHWMIVWNNNKSAFPLYHDPYHGDHVLAKDLPKLYKQNGAIYIQPYKQMKKNSYFYGKNPYLFETPIEESYDINSELDYEIAKTIYNFKKIKWNTKT